MAFVGDTALNSDTPELKPEFSVSLRRQEAEFAGYRCSRRGCNEPAHGPTLGRGKDVTDDEEAKAIPRGQVRAITQGAGSADIQAATRQLFCLDTST